MLAESFWRVFFDFFLVLFGVSLVWRVFLASLSGCLRWRVLRVVVFGVPSSACRVLECIIGMRCSNNILRGHYDVMY